MVEEYKENAESKKKESFIDKKGPLVSKYTSNHFLA